MRNGEWGKAEEGVASRPVLGPVECNAKKRGEVMVRALFGGAVLAALVCVVGVRAVLGDETPPVRQVEGRCVWPGGVAPELKRIQEELGGSVVEGFSGLRSAKPQAAKAAGRRREVEALREAASLLDVTANRLEQLDLYVQADALREQAQRMRVDARGMIKSLMPLGPIERAVPGIERAR